MESLDAVVIGAGIVGLAIARALALAGREVVILEAEEAIGTHTSSRNSEVIHAGIYYPKGSLKARAASRKRTALRVLRGHGIPHGRSGKLIVASPSQVPELEGIQSKAHANGVTDVVWMARAQALALEPELSCVAACTRLDRRHRQPRADARLPRRCPGERRDACAEEQLLGAQVAATAESKCTLTERTSRAASMVNSAGLSAPSVARPSKVSRSAHPASSTRRETTTRSREAPFQRLVYPVPEPAASACTSRSISQARRASGRTSNGSPSMD